MGQCPSAVTDVDQGSSGENDLERSGSKGKILHPSPSVLQNIFAAEHCLSTKVNVGNGFGSNSSNNFLRPHEAEPPEHNLLDLEEVDGVLDSPTKENFHDLFSEDDSTCSGDSYTMPLGSRIDPHKTKEDVTDEEFQLLVKNAGCVPVCAGPSMSGPAFGSGSEILRLTIPARMADFYKNNYLKQFSACPAPMPASNPNKHDVEERQDSKRSNSAPGGSGSGSGRRRVRWARDGTRFLNLSLEGSLGFQQHNLSPRKESMKKQQVVLFDNKARTVLAVCSLKSPYGPPHIDILSPKPRFPGQAPSSHRSPVDRKPLYSWAAVSVEGEFPLPVRYSLALAIPGPAKYERDPSYRASHTEVGLPEIKVTGRTSDERFHTGCCAISLQSPVEGDGPPFFALSVSRGVDPALFICLTAVVDEFLDSCIRHLCKKSQRNMVKTGESSSSSVLSAVRLDG